MSQFLRIKRQREAYYAEKQDILFSRVHDIEINSQTDFKKKSGQKFANVPY